jgi:hypothetical protein
MIEGMRLKNDCIEVPLHDITSLPNFLKIYHAAQNISTDPLYLKPPMPSRHFCPTVDNLVTMVALVTMVHYQSKATWLPWLPTVNKLVTMVQK